MIRVIRRGLQKPRVTQGTHLPGKLPGNSSTGAVYNLIRQHNGRGQIIARCQTVICHCRQRRPIRGLGLAAIIARRQHRTTCEHNHVAVAMFNIWMCHRSAQGPFLTALGQLRQVLANLDARRLCRDRIELTTHFLGCVRFEIKAFVLRQATGEKNVDDRLGSPGLGRVWPSHACAQPRHSSSPSAASPGRSP